jgi:hypothetical protein
MRISFALLSLLLLFSRCNLPQPLTPIELTFQQLSSKEMEALYADSLSYLLMKDMLLKMTVQNNAYDSLCMALFNYEKILFYSPNGYNEYNFERDSLLLVRSSSPIFCRVDSIVCLLRNQSATVFFKGRCADRQTAYEYNFVFYADSAGQEKYPQFKQFPCGVVLPKKKR